MDLIQDSAGGGGGKPFEQYPKKTETDQIQGFKILHDEAAIHGIQLWSPQLGWSPWIGGQGWDDKPRNPPEIYMWITTNPVRSIKVYTVLHRGWNGHTIAGLEFIDDSKSSRKFGCCEKSPRYGYHCDTVKELKCDQDRILVAVSGRAGDLLDQLTAYFGRRIVGPLNWDLSFTDLQERVVQYITPYILSLNNVVSFTPAYCIKTQQVVILLYSFQPRKLHQENPSLPGLRFEVYGFNTVPHIDISDPPPILSAEHAEDLYPVVKNFIKKHGSNHSNIVSITGGYIYNSEFKDWERQPHVIVCVCTKGYIPIGEDAIPKSFNGIRIKVLDGSCQSLFAPTLTRGYDQLSQFRGSKNSINPNDSLRVGKIDARLKTKSSNNETSNYLTLTSNCADFQPGSLIKFPGSNNRVIQRYTENLVMSARSSIRTKEDVEVGIDVALCSHILDDDSDWEESNVRKQEINLSQFNRMAQVRQLDHPQQCLLVEVWIAGIRKRDVGDYYVHTELNKEYYSYTSDIASSFVDDENRQMPYISKRLDVQFLQNQYLITAHFGRRYATVGDAGSICHLENSDEKRPWGVIHGQLRNEWFVYAIASPIEAILHKIEQDYGEVNLSCRSG